MSMEQRSGRRGSQRKGCRYVKRLDILRNASGQDHTVSRAHQQIMTSTVQREHGIATGLPVAGRVIHGDRTTVGLASHLYTRETVFKFKAVVPLRPGSYLQPLDVV